jgi:glucuronate isomerase
VAKTFITDDFLLRTKTAQRLYHDYAVKMGIFDYHCHLPPEEIAADKSFSNISQAWLYGDHYKWRAMRTNGVDERFCTGEASDFEKFSKWAETVPQTLCNPLYHWTHLELLRYFDIDDLLDGQSAKAIYDAASEKLSSPEYSVRNLMRKMNVKLVCTTEDPLDRLEHHQKLRDDGFEITVRTAWRPDKAMAAEDPVALNQWIDALAKLTDSDIGSYQSYIDAIRQRHEFFHANGCRLSDHGIETAYAEGYSDDEVNAIFQKIRGGQELEAVEVLKIKSALLVDFGVMDCEKGWVQQYHLGALRSNNSRLLEKLGPDTGFDSIGDFEQARPLAKLLDRLDSQDKLAKTILYNLNPADNALMATMIGNYQDGTVPGKIQFGTSWWFLDQKNGMQQQMMALSNMGLLSRFVGMLTDSRSYLSYPRHEYFRRTLCDILGTDVENGELPNDMELLGGMVENICFNNAQDYFGMGPFGPSSC